MDTQLAIPLESDLHWATVVVVDPMDCHRPMVDLAHLNAVPVPRVVVVVALPLESDLHWAHWAPVVVVDHLDCHRSLVDLADLKPVLALVVVALPLESDLH